MKSNPAIACLLLSCLPGLAYSADPCPVEEGSPPKVKKVTLDIGDQRLNLQDKKALNVDPNDTFEIHLKYKDGIQLPEGTKISVREKKDEPVQISGQVVVGSGGNPSKLDVTVGQQTSVTIGDEIEYYIEVDGVGTLDPKVQIITRMLMYSLVECAADFALEEELGMSLDEVNEYLKSPPSEAM